MIDLSRYITVMTCLRLSPETTRKSLKTYVAQTRVRRIPASSPTGLAESGSLSLRTGHSPQVAPHLFSRKRNYHCWIRAGNVSPEGTSTLLFKRLHRRTSHHRSRVMQLDRERSKRRPGNGWKSNSLHFNVSRKRKRRSFFCDQIRSNFTYLQS